MKTSTFTFKDQDNIDIFVYRWEPEINPKAIVQFIHGLAEHAKRYEGIAEALCKEGFVCYANDARGHGLTAGDLTEATLAGRAGVLGPNGWNGVVNDIHELSNIIKKEHPNLPLFLIGHSWGAMLLQDYIQEWGDEIKGCIISGTNGKIRALVLKAGKVIIKGEIKKLGPNAPSEKMHEMNFASYNHDWENDESATGFDWLSRDKSEVKKYVEDPWCGFVSPAPLWLEFIKGMEKIYAKKNEEKVPKELPIFFIAGTLDPVGNKTKGVSAIINRFEKYGIKDISHKFYENAHHEVFHEINRDEVFNDVINWLNTHL
jgi:alpha-beta hydrolase superfamily lysophospholipase